METPVWSTQTMPAQIHDLWAAQSRIWNTELISQIFDREATQCITHVPIVQSDSQDIVRWTPAKKGVCTTKEAFKMLNNDMQVLNSSTGAGGVTQQAQGILQRIWKHKTLPHILKTFTWRLIRRALGLWLLDIEQEGSLRKLTDFVLYANKLKMTHIFFPLALSQEQSGFQLHHLSTLLAATEQGGVQDTLSIIFQQITSPDSVQRIITTLVHLESKK